MLFKKTFYNINLFGKKNIFTLLFSHAVHFGGMTGIALAVILKLNF
jgi:hypothetical protein